MPKERILITVKTYPTLSEKYGELVCTAGVRPDGSWVRLYPVPFRRLDNSDRYRKFQWIEAGLVRNSSDPRPESFRLLDPDDISIQEHVGTEDNWRERRRLLMQPGNIHDDMSALIADAHANKRSLATFRPTNIFCLKVEPGSRDWPADRIAKLRARADQGELFSDEGWREAFRIVKPMPWKFSWRFADKNGRESTLQILDWEIGALYWNCLRDAHGDEEQAKAGVTKMYLEKFRQQDLHLFLGTTYTFHQMKAPNPWVIVGVFPVPIERQTALF